MHPQRIFFQTAKASVKKLENLMMDGTVRWFDQKKGYGFICNQDGSEVFVHYTGFENKNTKLRDGDKVSFEISQGEKGPRAQRVSLLTAK